MITSAPRTANRQPNSTLRRASSLASHDSSESSIAGLDSLAPSPAVELLQLEEDARTVNSQAELELLAANASRKFLNARQAFVLVGTKTMKLTAISGLPRTDRHAPFVQDIEALLSQLRHRRGLKTKQIFAWRDIAEPSQHELESQSYQALLWVPFCVKNVRPFGGLLIARAKGWSEAEQVLAERLAAIFGHALALLQSQKQSRSGWLSRALDQRWVIIGSILTLLAGLALPVPMATLSPFEVVPSSAMVTAAPIEGVIEAVHVQPGQQIEKGQPLIQFADTTLRNRYEIAEREVLVASARLKKASQLAFDDIEGRHELRLAMADQALKVARRDFAYDLLRRTTVTAETTGIALFADRKSLVGKPVTLGEKIMRIAQPNKVEIAVDVAIADAVALEKGAQVRLYFASDPLHTRDAEIELVDYRARRREGETPTHRVIAKLSGQDKSPPRLGMRGTAKIYGSQVPLGLYLFRRPLTATRQWLGL